MFLKKKKKLTWQKNIIKPIYFTLILIIIICGISNGKVLCFGTGRGLVMIYHWLKEAVSIHNKFKFLLHWADKLLMYLLEVWFGCLLGAPGSTSIERLTSWYIRPKRRRGASIFPCSSTFLQYNCSSFRWTQVVDIFSSWWLIFSLNFSNDISI